MTLRISRIHEEIRNARTTRRGATHHPDAVPRGEHKAYPRMQKIPLPAAQKITLSLDDAIVGRRSFLTPRSLDGFTDEELGTLLGLSLGVSAEKPFRHYPSGGALYPIETYLIGAVRKNSEPGVYHYHPTLHALEYLWKTPPGFEALDLNTTAIRIEGSMRIVFTALWSRSSAKYGDFSYSHALIEAGHMAQNILLVAAALGFDARPLAGFDDELVHELLHIRAPREQAVYSITLSPRTLS